MQPHAFESWVNRALRQTGEMMELLTMEEHFPLEELQDISDALKRAKIEGNLLNPEFIMAIGKQAASARKMKSFIRNRDEKYPELSEISNRIIVLKDLEEEIDRVLNEHGSVRDNASPELSSIRKQLNSRKNDVRKSLQSVIRRASKSGYMAEQEATLRNGRMVIPIKAEHKRKINGFVHDVSSTGQTVYLEPAEVLHINNDIRELESSEYREIERILQQLTAIIRNYIEPLKMNSVAIGEIDLIHGKAQLGLQMNGIIPKIATEDSMRLLQVKNPVLLLKQDQNEEEVIPLTMDMNPEERGLIITGPNAGGKSVAMKTTGLCHMMMLSGFALPSKEPCELPLVDSIFMDMGDEQSIENDLSTFSSRLEWIKVCARDVTSQSLILIDEAGSGTDPEEGTALYQSLIEDLTEKGARMVVTTHHGALKVFAHDHPKWINGSMEFDQKNLSPTYHFKKGVPGSSYAFDIAQRLGVQTRITEKARKLLGSSKNKMEHLISELQQRSYEADDIKSGIEKERKAFDQQKKEYDQKMEKLTKERDQIRQNALFEANKVINNANKKIEDAIRRIVESNADKLVVKQVKQELQKQGGAVNDELEEIRKRKKSRESTDPPKVGDEVKMMDTNSTGELVELKGKQAIVMMNGLRVKTKYHNLIKVEQQKKKKSSKPMAPRYTLQGGQTNVLPTSYSLDLRGNRGEEAISKVTTFLDNAMSRGLERVEIVHGKGEGILKKMVHEYLATRKDISSFDIAPIDQGGHGCTVVELK